MDRPDVPGFEHPTARIDLPELVDLEPPASGFRRWAPAAAALPVAALLAWYAFVQQERVPLLGWADLGFHELGHLLTYPFPPLVTASMGSITQVMVPVGLAAYFLAWRRDLVAAGLMLAWAGTSAQDASVYVADAPYERLPLIGGEHDWAYVLGPEQFDVLEHAGTIARAAFASGVLLWLAGLALLLTALYRVVDHRRERPIELPGVPVVRAPRYAAGADADPFAAD
jgi:hypothetical protein